MRKVMLNATFVVFILVFLGIASHAHAQIGEEVIGPTGAISHGRFKSWSLFLVCNPEWLSPERSSDLYVLYSQFRNFGRAIGDDHDAVWFWKSATSSSDPSLAEKVDVERSAKFCEAFGIKPSSSPSVLVTSDYPDFGKPTRNFTVIELGKMPSNQISAVLAKISDQLLLQGRIAPPTGADRIRDVLGRVAQAVAQALLDSACNFHVKFGLSTTFEVTSAWCSK
jgi:hypothetical protein